MTPMVHIGSMEKDAQGKLITVANQNPYYNIRAVLNRLGITNSPTKDHNTHFHIYLRPPTARDLPRNLNAEVVNEINAGVQQADTATIGADQPFDISYNEDSQTGESAMLMSLLIPYLPPLDEASVVSPPVIMAQATTTATGASTMTLGNCEDVQTPDNPDGRLGGQISPAGVLRQYWEEKLNKKFFIQDAKVTILNGPMHGKISAQWLSKSSGPTFAYNPNQGFLGQDKITFLVEIGGKSVKVETTLIVVKVAGLHGSPCATGVKRISSSSDTPDLATNFAIDQLASILTAVAGVTVTITPLASGALGQTTNTSITLDDNAAGNNWFIDTKKFGVRPYILHPEQKVRGQALHFTSRNVKCKA